MVRLEVRAQFDRFVKVSDRFLDPRHLEAFHSSQVIGLAPSGIEFDRARKVIDGCAVLFRLGEKHSPEQVRLGVLRIRPDRPGDEFQRPVPLSRLICRLGPGQEFIASLPSCWRGNRNEKTKTENPTKISLRCVYPACVSIYQQFAHENEGTHSRGQ